MSFGTLRGWCLNFGQLRSAVLLTLVSLLVTGCTANLGDALEDVTGGMSHARTVIPDPPPPPDPALAPDGRTPAVDLAPTQEPSEDATPDSASTPVPTPMATLVGGLTPEPTPTFVNSPSPTPTPTPTPPPASTSTPTPPQYSPLTPVEPVLSAKTTAYGKVYTVPFSGITSAFLTPANFAVSVASAQNEAGGRIVVMSHADPSETRGPLFAVKIPQLPNNKQRLLAKITASASQNKTWTTYLAAYIDGLAPRVQYHVDEKQIPYMFSFGRVSSGQTIIFELLGEYAGHQDPFLAMTIESVELIFVDAELKTSAYLQSLDLDQLQRDAVDYFNPRYSFSRIANDINSIDIIYDYDFEGLDATQERLFGIDRQPVLNEIFNRITAGATDNRQRHEMVLNFLSKNGFHNIVQAMWRDNIAVFDPLILLETHEYQCGQSARIAVDLFEAAGYAGRVVQLFNHVAAEIFYDGGWHMFDADMLVTDGSPVIDGEIPSFEKLSLFPQLIDAVPITLKPHFDVTLQLTAQFFPYRWYFSAPSYFAAGLSFGYYQRNKTQDRLGDRHYGWESYSFALDPDVQLSSLPEHHLPGAPYVSQITVDDASDGRRFVSLTWNASDDPDGDVYAYDIFFGSVSRGWNYNQFTGPSATLSYWSNSNGWVPEMYDQLYKLPPSDLGVIRVFQTDASVEIPDDEDVFITIMPRDQYGDSLGRLRYELSHEFKIPRK